MLDDDDFLVSPFIRKMRLTDRLFLSKKLADQFIQERRTEGTPELFGLRIRIVKDAPEDMALLIGADGSMVLLDMRPKCATSKKRSTKSSRS